MSGSQKLIQVHIGGSPLLDLSKKDRKPAQDAYFKLRGMSDVHSAVTLELPKTNRFWSDGEIEEVSD